jgi:hypothetical protein
LKKITLQKYEDFTTYTKDKDPQNKIQLPDPNTIESTLVKNEYQSLYKDFGKDYFGDFILELDSKVLDYDIKDSTATCYNHFASWQNEVGKPMLGVADNDDLIYILWIHYRTGQLGVEIKQHGRRNVRKQKDWRCNGFSKNVWYYFRIIRKGKSFSFEIYSDPARTKIAIRKAEITLDADFKFRFFVPAQCYGISVEHGYISAISTNYKLIKI